MAMIVSYHAAHQNRCGVRRGGMNALQHNNSFNRSGNSLFLIENLNVTADASRPVNSGVRPLR